MEGFTRRSTALLTRSSLSRLAYLERIGLIVPHRSGQTNRPLVLYSWEQVLEIRAMNQLRRQLSFQRIRKIIRFLDDHGFDPSLRNKQLVVLNDTITWVKSLQTSRPQVIQITDKSNRCTGQLLLSLFPLATADSSLPSSAITNPKVIDIRQFQHNS